MSSKQYSSSGFPDELVNDSFKRLSGCRIATPCISFVKVDSVSLDIHTRVGDKTRVTRHALLLLILLHHHALAHTRTTTRNRHRRRRRRSTGKEKEMGVGGRGGLGGGGGGDGGAAAPTETRRQKREGGREKRNPPSNSFEGSLRQDSCRLFYWCLR